MINSIDKFKMCLYSYSKFKGGAHVAASGARGGTGAIVLNFFYMSTEDV